MLLLFGEKLLIATTASIYEYIAVDDDDESDCLATQQFAMAIIPYNLWLSFIQRTNARKQKKKITQQNEKITITKYDNNK